MSAGNLYRYFPSKEAIIADISERNRVAAAENFVAVNQAPDFFAGLAAVARQYMVERSAEEVGLCAEIMAESRRNPDIARLYQEVERDIKASLVAMLQRAAARGEIRRDPDFEVVAAALMVLGDGMSWRRAVDPAFAPEAVLPLIMRMVHGLLGKPEMPQGQARLP